MSCMNSISFHRTIALLSSVFGQLCRFSLELEAFSSITDPLIISGDIIQQLCIDRLQSTATYSLNLLLYTADDFEKINFNSFFKVPFIHRQQPKVFILEIDSQDVGARYHCFRVCTVPYYNGMNPLCRKIFSRKLFLASKYAAKVRVMGKKSFDEMFFGEEGYNLTYQLM